MNVGLIYAVRAESLCYLVVGMQIYRPEVSTALPASVEKLRRELGSVRESAHGERISTGQVQFESGTIHASHWCVVPRTQGVNFSARCAVIPIDVCFQRIYAPIRRKGLVTVGRECPRMPWRAICHK
jgi:hypothetical protein